VTLVAEGRRVVKRVVDVDESGGQLDLALEPAELPAPIAGSCGLRVRCRTGGLRVLVDGEDSGARCPTGDKLLLSCGSHRLALYDPLTDSTIPVHREAHLRPDRTARIYLKY